MKKNKSINQQNQKKMSTTKTKKSMLNTKDMSATSGRVKPVIDPGNHTIKINSITFDQTPYDTEAWNIVLHVETEPVQGEFEGFLTDSNDTSSPRYKGQVGRIRFSPWPFKDADLPSGRKISRDTEILKSMIYLAETLEVRDELDSIEAETIEDFMVHCNNIFSDSKFLNACVGGRQWENKEGYINNDLFLPRISKDGIPLERLHVENSRLLNFNTADHVKEIKKKENVASFEPPSNGSSDFEL